MNKVVKKRLRLSNFVFNMAISSKKPINNNIEEIISEMYENYIYVNKRKRPSEELDGNIKIVSPEFKKISPTKYQFKINIRAYTVLKFNYAKFMSDLSKSLKVPSTMMKIDILKPDEDIELDNNSSSSEENEEEEPPRTHKHANKEKEPEKKIFAIPIKPKEILREEKPKSETTMIIEDPILEEPPLTAPTKYVEALHNMEAIPTGKSSLPKMKALDNNKNDPEAEKVNDNLFQNLVFALGGALVGSKLSKTGVSSQKSASIFL